MNNPRNIAIAVLLGFYAGIALLMFGLTPGCVTSPRIATRADVDAAVKAIGDDIRANATASVKATVQAGGDVQQAIENSSKTTTTIGIPWYGLVGLAVSFGALMLLIRRYGYHPGTWKAKERLQCLDSIKAGHGVQTAKEP